MPKTEVRLRKRGGLRILVEKDEEGKISFVGSHTHKRQLRRLLRKEGYPDDPGFYFYSES